MKNAYVVFSDNCDAGIEFFKTYDEAQKEFADRIDDPSSNSVDTYLCSVMIYQPGK
ncbi:hypothetical protein P4U97_15235 [Bacillus swezeyi]|uniref:hypothetical protein n=1 Tax=Bacillus swezeyi TaxID=1925020 RepID=UPI002E204BCA|nr:hypothetical protein [Bacillus swezeyi]